MAAQLTWVEALKPLLKKYRGKKHPLEYKNLYELLVMVVLSAQDSDRHINQLSGEIFKAFPNMEALSRATADSLFPLIGSVRNFANKTKWLIELPQKIKKDSNIPTTMEGLTALPGIGRKSANVIMREANVKPEGVIVDLHVLRVAPRLGISKATNPVKIEKDIMAVIPQNDWDVGMCMSFLGREICRPTNPKHEECVLKDVCEFHNGKKMVKD
jgi:endonuclease III